MCLFKGLHLLPGPPPPHHLSLGEAAHTESFFSEITMWVSRVDEVSGLDHGLTSKLGHLDKRDGIYFFIPIILCVFRLY